MKLKKQLVNYNNNFTFMKTQHFIKLANDLYNKMIALITHYVLYKIHKQ